MISVVHIGAIQKLCRPYGVGWRLVKYLAELLWGSGVKRHVGKKACLFKSRGVKRHVVKSQSVNWHAVFRQSMKKGMFPLGLTRVDNIFS